MPNRILKESITTSPEIDAVSEGAEILFYRLMVVADDYGCFEGDPDIIQSRCFPKGRRKRKMPVSRVRKVLAELVDAGLVVAYVVEARPFVALRTWENHQQRRAKKPKYPTPEEGRLIAPEDICNQLHANVPVFGIRDTGYESRDSVALARSDRKRNQPELVKKSNGTRQPDEVWDALVKCFGEPPRDRRFRGAWNTAAAELRGQGATPAEIALRVVRYRAQMPDVACTPTALAKHWGRLAEDVPASKQISKFDAARAARRTGAT